MAILVTSAAPVFASFTYYATVAVPMINDDRGACEIHPVTFLMSRTGYLPGYEVSLTCEPGFGTRPRVGGAWGGENLNAANREGLTLEVRGLDRLEDVRNWTLVDSSAVGVHRYRVDTLYVVLHTDSAYALARQGAERSWQHVVAATGGAVPRDSEREARLRAESMEKHLQFTDQLVDATIDCILDNAARSIPPIGVVELVVEGSGRVNGKSGVYAPRRAHEGPGRD